MKRFALFLVAIMLTVFGMAQNSYKRPANVPGKMAKIIKKETKVSDENALGSPTIRNAAAPKASETLYVKMGEPVNVQTTVINHGVMGIYSLDVEYTLNGITQTKHIVPDEPLAGILGISYTFDAELQTIDTNGNYDLLTNVVKVNGYFNEDSIVKCTSPIVVVNTIPKHRALLEEYTGTWCGWCVRGYVALENLAKLYPDDYVLVSYHNGDPMEILCRNTDLGVNEFPSDFEGYPSAMVDRVIAVDPYYGYSSDYGKEPLTVTKPLSELSKLFGHADIQLEARLNESLSAVDVNTTVTFPYSDSDVNYGLEYVLVADGLTGQGREWAQSNYYSGNLDLDGYLAPFGKQGSLVSGLEFNDVAVQVSAKNGISIEGSIPTVLEAGEAISHGFQFSLDSAVNTKNNLIIQDLNKLKVVAILVNNETGEVINSNKCVVDSSTGICITDSSCNVFPVAIYDLRGRQISTPQRGLNIILMSNGLMYKVMIK